MGWQIVGGASKLFSAGVKWCKENLYGKIISWSDNRWSNGNIYIKLGFDLEKNMPPDYSYVDNSKHIRLSKQSCKKSDINCPPDVTEKKWMINNGFARIWDCGKKRWVWNSW